MRSAPALGMSVTMELTALEAYNDVDLCLEHLIFAAMPWCECEALRKRHVALGDGSPHDLEYQRKPCAMGEAAEHQRPTTLLGASLPRHRLRTRDRAGGPRRRWLPVRQCVYRDTLIIREVPHST